MAEELLRVDHITKQYEGNIVLKDLSLSVCQGEVVVIVGPSGCGKSTLLRCMNGLEPIQAENRNGISKLRIIPA